MVTGRRWLNEFVGETHLAGVEEELVINIHAQVATGIGTTKRWYTSKAIRRLNNTIVPYYSPDVSIVSTS